MKEETQRKRAKEKDEKRIGRRGEGVRERCETVIPQSPHGCRHLTAY